MATGSTQIGEVQGRPSFRCGHCNLVQFLTMDKKCRRCRTEMVTEVTYEPPVYVAPAEEPVAKPALALTLSQTIGARVCMYRQAKGLTQTALAIQFGNKGLCHSLSRIESAHLTPSVGYIERLAEILGVHPSFLVKPYDEGWFDEEVEQVVPYVPREKWNLILHFVKCLTFNRDEAVAFAIEERLLRRNDPRKAA